MESRFRALKFVQNDRVFYSVALPASEIIKRSAVDEWNADDPDEERGYQRALQKSRVRGVADYVSREDAIMPLGGLLNARSSGDSEWGTELRFEPDAGQSGVIQSGELVIPDDALPLWTVDMQHRLAGFEHAINELERHDLNNFPLVVTIADGLTKMEEIGQFEIINTTQKKVATDLARQLLAREYVEGGVEALHDVRKAWEARGALIANWLNENGAVLKDRIIPPNKTARQVPHGVTKQTTFVSSLRPVLTSPYMQRMDEDQVARLVDEYWRAVRALWPAAVDYPKDSIILKGPGVYPLHMVLPEVLEIVRDRQQPPSAENMQAAMEQWLALGEDYWDKDNTDTGATRYGSSGQGHSRTAAELRSLLPRLSFEMFDD